MCKYLGMESLRAFSLFFLLKIHKEGVKSGKQRMHTGLCPQAWMLGNHPDTGWEMLRSRARPGGAL